MQKLIPTTSSGFPGAHANNPPDWRETLNARARWCVKKTIVLTLTMVPAAVLGFMVPAVDYLEHKLLTFERTPHVCCKR